MHPSLVEVVDAVRAHSRDSLAVFLAMCAMLVEGLRSGKPLPSGAVCDVAARVLDRAALVTELTNLLSRTRTWADVDAAQQPRGATRSDTQKFSRWMTRCCPFDEHLDESTAESPFKPLAARTVQSEMTGDLYMSEVANAISRQDRRALSFTAATSS